MPEEALLKHADNNDLGVQIHRRREPERSQTEHHRGAKTHRQVTGASNNPNTCKSQAKGLCVARDFSRHSHQDYPHGLINTSTVVCQSVTTPSSRDVPKRGSHMSTGSRTRSHDSALGRARFGTEPVLVLPRGALAGCT